MSQEEDASYADTDHYISKIIDRFRNPLNKTEDFSRPILRPVFSTTYPLIIFVYSLLIISGIIMNFAMACHILRCKLYKDPTHAFLINMIISDIIKCIFVLPISLAVMMIENWIFGKFLCFFLPMLQDIPLHVSMMTYMLIAVDRFRMVSEPGKQRIPAFVCALGSWFFAVCIVLPYPIYTTYFDLESYLQHAFKGLGICFANLADDMQEYMRGLFIGTYVTPLAIMAYLYVKASRELQSAEGPMALGMLEAREPDIYSRHDSNASNDISNMRDSKRDSITAGDSIGLPIDLYEPELDIRKETRTQKYLIFMVSAFAICLCPLMVLRLAKLALYETYENSGYFDITYTIFVWIAFMPTVTTPVLYASWQMSRIMKERLRNYFRFSNRHLKHSEDGTISRSEPQTNVISVDQPHLCRIGSISGNNSGSTGGRTGSARGSVRGSTSTRGISNLN